MYIKYKALLKNERESTIQLQNRKLDFDYFLNR